MSTNPVWFIHALEVRICFWSSAARSPTSYAWELSLCVKFFLKNWYPLQMSPQGELDRGFTVFSTLGHSLKESFTRKNLTEKLHIFTLSLKKLHYRHGFHCYIPPLNKTRCSIMADCGGKWWRRYPYQGPTSRKSLYIFKSKIKRTPARGLLKWKSAGMLSGRLWVKTPAGLSPKVSKNLVRSYIAVIKRRGLGISPGYYERGRWLLS